MEGWTKQDLRCLVLTEKEQKSSWDWSRDSLMERVLSTQLIVGLASFSQGSPRIIFSFPRLRMLKVIHWAIPLMSRNKVVENQITPLELMELSAFCAWIEVFRRWVGSLCFLTNLQSMQEILAPLSMRAQMSTAFIVCEGVMSWTGICIVGDDFTNTFAHNTEGRVCIGNSSCLKIQMFERNLSHHHLFFIVIYLLQLGKLFAADLLYLGVSFLREGCTGSARVSGFSAVIAELLLDASFAFLRSKL